MDDLGLIEPFNMSVQVLTIFSCCLSKNCCSFKGLIWTVERMCQRPLLTMRLERKLTKILKQQNSAKILYSATRKVFKQLLLTRGLKTVRYLKYIATHQS